jgi:acetolactate synthase-1/3 small subunit
VKVTAAPDRRAELVSLADVFGARVVDVGSAAMTFEIVEHPTKLGAFEELLRPYGIKETVRTGRVAIRRSSTDSHRRSRMRVIA